MPDEPSARIAIYTSSEEARRLRISIRGHHALTILIAGVIFIPIVLYYTGFVTLKGPPVLVYPKLYEYPLRLTPYQNGHHGIDFSQIWLSARKMSAGEKVYYPVLKAKWRREWSSTYHPLIHWLYIPLGKLPFPTALVLHNLFGIALLLGCSFLALRQAGCGAAFPSIALLIPAAMYLTPSGLLHVERGQMDVYVGASMLTTVTLFRSGGRGWAIATAVLSTLKVQAWIFVGFYAIVAAPLFGLRERNLWWVPAIIVGTSLVFLNQVLEWIPSFLYVADNASTHGSPFVRILPKPLAYGLPFASTAAMALAAFLALRMHSQLGDVDARRRLLERISFPFAAAIALQTVCGTAVTHDYRLIAFLGLLPALSIWTTRTPDLPTGVRSAVVVGYLTLLAAVLRVPPFIAFDWGDTAYLMLAASMAFLALAAFLAPASRSPASA